MKSCMNQALLILKVINIFVIVIKHLSNKLVHMHTCSIVVSHHTWEGEKVEKRNLDLVTQKPNKNKLEERGESRHVWMGQRLALAVTR